MASSTSAGSREPSPNRGRGIEDYIADTDDMLDQKKFREEFGIDKSKQIKIVKLVFVRYQHPDLKSTSVFLRGVTVDFTMIGGVANNEDFRFWPFLSEEDGY